VRRDGERITDPQCRIAAGSENVFQVGKRRFRRVRLVHEPTAKE
jgi:tyrosyl-tRNA synthetase